MARISVELVPRKKETFIKELELVKSHFPCVDTINIPDILRYEIRSLEGCRLAKSLFPRAIPHLRAVAIDKKRPLSVKEFLTENKIREVLAVLGDREAECADGFYPCITIELLKKFKKEMPRVKVYAGIDQYRGSFKEEYDYIQKKIDAGADGFFTQPFFDFSLLELYSRSLKNIEIFWGVSPVTSERSKYYWENKNNIRFPENFSATLEWNKVFARKVFEFSRTPNFHIYFMPIKTDVVEYLTGII